MRRIMSVLMALLLVCSIPLSALAIDVDVTYGDVVITGIQVTHTDSTNTTKTEYHEGAVTVSGSSTENTITVKAYIDVTVTLDNVTLTVDNRGDYSRTEAAMTVTTGENTKVTVELEGDNTLEGGPYSAGLQTENNLGSLEITDVDGDGSLYAHGGQDAAGIGGASEGDGTNISISGGTIMAQGLQSGAGIGGGLFGNGENIVISGGDVTAICGYSFGAGIGGGAGGDGVNITISGGNVTAEGGLCGGSGIGGGQDGDGIDITIYDCTVIATGGGGGAGIGGGAITSLYATGGNGTNITISGGKVIATGSNGEFGIEYAGIGGAGIGGGCNYFDHDSCGEGSNITIGGYAQVDAIGDGNAANVGDGSGRNTTEKLPDNLTLTLESDYYAPHSDDHGDRCGIYNDIHGCDGKEAPAEPDPDEDTSTAELDSYIIYTVDTPRWEEDWDYEKGILTLTALDINTNTVKEEATFTTWGYGIDALMHHYKIKTVRFITANAERELDLAELAKLVTVAGDEFDLVHKGSESTLMLNNVDVEEKLQK